MISNNYSLQSSNSIYFQPNKIAQTNNSSVQSIENHRAFASVPLGAYNDRLISFTSLPQYAKGSTPEVAHKLKALRGPLEEKMEQAKNIILTDLGLPSDSLKLLDCECGQGSYAAYSIATGTVGFNKKICQQENSQFSDDAVMCILRHELDHMVIFTRLYKTLGRDKFEQLWNTAAQTIPQLQKLPAEEKVVNHQFYQEMSKYVEPLSASDTKKYTDALKNYDQTDPTGTEYSNFRLFTLITNNFNNELENSARNVQYQLEDQMGVTTLKDFYSMIDHTKALKAKLAELVNQNPSYKKGDDTVEILFDYLYHKSAVETGLEDKTQNWGKIIANAEGKVQSISTKDIEEARKYRAEKIAASKSSQK